MTTFQALIAAHGATQPRSIAFHIEAESIDWQTLHEHTTRAAGALIRMGIAPGDRVALLGGASAAYLEGLFGTIAARGCVVPLPVSASTETLQALLADCAAKVLFVDADVGEAIGPIAQQQGVQVIGLHGDAFAAWRDSADPATPLPVGQAEDAFNIIYSSGTTGLPKGIVHLHDMRQRQATRKGFFSPQARTLLSTPMYSNTTLMPMLGTLANGGTCILMRKFDAGGFLQLVARHRVTHTMLVPVQYRRILAHPDFDRSDLSSLELSQTTGAPMDAALKREILDRWPGRLLEVYGLTEGGVSFFLDARAHPDKLATVGKAGHGTEAFLIDEAGQRIPPDQVGATGEVVGRSPFMMAGYHNRPEATAEIRWVDEQGTVYHRSGDIGRFDADGFLTLLDRAKDVIISGGHNIHAADLEAVLLRHEAVADAAVIGVPSPQWGETPLALVVPKPGMSIDAAALREWVNAQVGKTQRLSAVELREELPRSALGKLSKKELRAPWWDAARKAKEPA
ncbi:MAG TPA: AMP-binding protein [Ramlibacter sp.]|nr:AMP-binding protein [Ramlibacter sp.]